MTGTVTAAGVSEKGPAYDVFGPVWAVLDLGAAAGAESLTEFVAARREELDGLLGVVRRLGDFSPELMQIFERQGGWADGRHEVTAEFLMLHSGCIEEYPPNVDDPAVLRRMVSMGGDLQLTKLVDGLVGAGAARGVAAESGAPLVVAAVRAAAALLGVDGGPAARDAFRMWRVVYLPGVLVPDSPTPQAAKECLRAYARALEVAVAA
ncbi:hypothetical protein [Streptomyces sp. S.PB5]|uniref:hypothetical protein n=1 Tax=Streptomyces sp. S.PB5 TaxID=3020844 RepID=UPI0025B1BDEB|nr:hypothetical protein [Streptomyces sp. S.PB5]MDN3024794.1 hypothetical protein [Streptomyces sp. S.PB5]